MKTLLLGSFLAAFTQLSHAAPSHEVTTVPEPSAAIMGGICGIIFLLWRKK